MEALKAVYDVFLWLPTEYGKSVSYQALSFPYDHKLKLEDLPAPKRSVCVIVSPQISLMNSWCWMCYPQWK